MEMDYLVKDWTEVNDIKSDEPKLIICNQARLFEIIDHAKSNPNIKISIYLIGPCVLDWS